MKRVEQYFECNAPSVIFERFADETILINLDAGHYYSMDPVGAVIWELVNRALPIDRVVEIVTSRYTVNGDDVGELVHAYVARMRDEGLLRPRREAPPAVVDAGEVSVAHGTVFTPPVLAKYVDMEEMLLLDPVHDVTEAGWPAPAPQPAENGTAQIEDDYVSSWPSLDDES